VTASRKDHWDRVYTDKTPESVSWSQANPAMSLALIKWAGVSPREAVLDVGGGSSALVDRLLESGFAELTVMDISAVALAHAKARIGENSARKVEWIVADVTDWAPSRRFDLWHDRAVLHFLTTPADKAAYAATLRAALKPGGAAIIGGFAPGGPERCSGLPVVRHDAASLSALLGPQFSLIDVRDEVHLTPQGLRQPFRFHVFRRRRDDPASH
jgi:SAM-dependent methyltransferase